MRDDVKRLAAKLREKRRPWGLLLGVYKDMAEAADALERMAYELDEVKTERDRSNTGWDSASSALGDLKAKTQDWESLWCAFKAHVHGGPDFDLREALSALSYLVDKWDVESEHDKLRAEVERLRAFIQPIADGDCTHINCESAWDDHPDCNEMIRDNPCLRCRARAALAGEGDDA